MIDWKELSRTSNAQFNSFPMMGVPKLSMMTPPSPQTSKNVQTLSPGDVIKLRELGGTVPMLWLMVVHWYNAEEYD